MNKNCKTCFWNFEVDSKRVCADSGNYGKYVKDLLQEYPNGCEYYRQNFEEYIKNTKLEDIL